MVPIPVSSSFDSVSSPFHGTASMWGDIDGGEDGEMSGALDGVVIDGVIRGIASSISSDHIKDSSCASHGSALDDDQDSSAATARGVLGGLMGSSKEYVGELFGVEDSSRASGVASY